MSGFRVALKQVSDRLGSDDIDALKYLCEAVVPLSELEKVKTGTQLFAALQRRNKISEDNTAFLEHLLQSLGKEHLMKYITDPGFGQGVTPRPQLAPTPGRNSPFGVGVLSPNAEMEYRKMLASVATNLTNHNFSEMLYVSADYFKGVQPRSSKPLDFFSLLEQRGLLSPTNLSTLQALLSEVGRNDLIERLQMFVGSTRQPPGFTSTHLTSPLQESYVQHSATAPPMDPFRDPPDYYSAFSQPGALHQLNYPPTPNRARSGFKDTPFGEAQEQPHSSVPQYVPGHEHRSTGSGDVAQPVSCGQQSAPPQDLQCPVASGREPQLTGFQYVQHPVAPEREHQITGPQSMHQCQDQSTGKIVGLGNMEGPPLRQVSDKMDCLEQHVRETTSSSRDTTTQFPYQESAANDQVGQSAFRSTTPAPAAYLQMERQNPNDPRVQEYRQKDIQEEMLMEAREREARMTQEDAQRKKMEQRYQNEIRRLEREKAQLVKQVQREQQRSSMQRVVVPDDLCYPMNADPHGLCIIFNNDKFYATSSKEELPDRKGSDVDQHNLNIIFSRLKYRVQSYKNSSAARMMEIMKAVSNSDHSSCDSLVCCMLTHGKMEGVFGADGTLVPVADLANLVKASYCSTLKGKPKMFFVQACRGDDEDRGVQLQSDDGEQSVVRRSLPNDADFLFAYSTAPGTVSWRSPQYGSWYISKLCETLDQHAMTGMDLVSMLTIVNDKVSEAYTKQGFKQCPAPVNMLRKKVVF